MAFSGWKSASKYMWFKIPRAVLYVCVARTWDNVRLKALALWYVLNTHIMGVESLENFLRTGSHFFFGLVYSVKKWILVVNEQAEKKSDFSTFTGP